MKKIIFMSLIICLVSFGAVYARNDKAALLYTGPCYVAADNPLNFCGVDLYSAQSINVSTSGGMTNLTCQFILPEGCEPPAKLTILRNQPCPVYTKECEEITTYDSLFIITPAGIITTICQYDAKEECIP
jgi:hypothetical protein